MSEALSALRIYCISSPRAISCYLCVLAYSTSALHRRYMTIKSEPPSCHSATHIKSPDYFILPNSSEFPATYFRSALSSHFFANATTVIKSGSGTTSFFYTGLQSVSLLKNNSQHDKRFAVSNRNLAAGIGLRPKNFQQVRQH
ncbi:hypothetical protein SAMN06264348_101207 [Oceanospirillum linum]|nr:hypothetical protein SAMN04489856_101206 [Oleiphilus messinensis]SMP01737.1 hypothetical protein SAMN06264348_101207 [Oceanospirillum linum]